MSAPPEVSQEPRRSAAVAWLTDSVFEPTGRWVIGTIEEIGQFALLTLHAVGWMFRPPFRLRLLFQQMEFVGVRSLSIVIITGTFTGMVFSLQSAYAFGLFGAETLVGPTVALALSRELSPSLVGILVAARAGSAMAAELGTMRVTEQLDAMRAMGADPIPQLVVPRFVACVVMTPILTIYSDLLGVWGGWLVTVQFFGVAPYEYWDFTKEFVVWWEPISGLIKAVFFGGSIGLIACYKGFSCEAGAAGVGRAATEAFVASFIAIIVINLVLAQALNTIYDLFIREAGIGSAG